MHLGQDRRGRDRLHLGIALDDGLGRHRQHRQPVAVDQHLGRLQAQALDRAAHRQHAWPAGCSARRSPRRWPRRCSSTAPWRGSRRTGARACAALSAFESARPLIGCRSSRITAAATTGPASGPRPASSTPATRPGASKLRPSCSARKNLRDRIGGGARGVAAQLAGAARRSASRSAAQRCGSSSQAQRGLRPALAAWHRPGAARARRSRAAGCWAGRPRAGSSCASSSASSAQCMR